MFDFNTFAPFTLEMLERIHDELPKAPIFTIPSLSTALPQNNDLCQVSTVIIQQSRPPNLTTWGTGGFRPEDTE